MKTGFERDFTLEIKKNGETIFALYEDGMCLAPAVGAEQETVLAALNEAFSLSYVGKPKLSVVK